MENELQQTTNQQGTEMTIYKEAEMVIPAVFRPNMIGTPDQTVMRFPTPFEMYSYVQQGNKPKTIDDYLPMRLNSEIFDSQVKVVCKQMVITCFNLINNAPEGVDGLVLINPESAMLPITNTKPTREAANMFCTRETLDEILKEIDSIYLQQQYDDEGMMQSRYPQEYTVEYAFEIINRIYNVCLNHVDTQEDVMNLNRFIILLTDYLPMALVMNFNEFQNILDNGYKKSKNLKKRRQTNTSPYFLD